MEKFVLMLSICTYVGLRLKFPMHSFHGRSFDVSPKSVAPHVYIQIFSGILVIHESKIVLQKMPITIHKGGTALRSTCRLCRVSGIGHLTCWVLICPDSTIGFLGSLWSSLKKC